MLIKDLINKFCVLNGSKYFSSGIFQNYLVLKTTRKYIKFFNGTTLIDLWKSNGMSKENTENITKSGTSFAPTFVNYDLLPDKNVNWNCLIKNNISIPKKVTYLYIFYTLNPHLRNLNTDFRLGNCLIESVKLTKNADLDKYKYNGSSIGFGSRSEFSLPDGSMGKSVIIFGADRSSSVHIDNKRKDMLTLDKGPTQGLDDSILTAEAKYSINLHNLIKDLY